MSEKGGVKKSNWSKRVKKGKNKVERRSKNEVKRIKKK